MKQIVVNPNGHPLGTSLSDSQINILQIKTFPSSASSEGSLAVFGFNQLRLLPGGTYISNEHENAFINLHALHKQLMRRGKERASFKHPSSDDFSNVPEMLCNVDLTQKTWVNETPIHPEKRQGTTEGRWTSETL